jgi:glycosyltransferase involved in cell wall biosynthesis
MKKKRLLFSGEASFLATGFSVFQREMLRALHATGKYEVAEFGSWASVCKESKALPWKFYGNLPVNEQEAKIYKGNEANHFGAYKIDAVLADWQPDHVIGFRDPWMEQHVVNSRFRNNFKYIWCSTVDSAPQRRDWIENIYKKTDVVCTYSLFGKRTLEADGIPVEAVLSPGVDLEVFRPMDKVAVRDEFHITQTLFVFGTVMRNQRRKLFPDLFDAYRRLRDKYAVRQVVERAKGKAKAGQSLSASEKEALRIDHSVLYCHTSWPDLGWDLPDYLRRFQLQRHVIFTYTCDACKKVFADWFAPCDSRGIRQCRECGEIAAHMPSTHAGISTEMMGKVYNLFDVYIQPAICEGWGVPITESKACGVPGLYQAYSAMEDHIANGGGLPIRVQRLYHEAETASIRSLPDIDDLTAKMAKLALNDSLRATLGKEARTVAISKHTWQETADKLMYIVDNLKCYDRTTTWDKPPTLSHLTTRHPPEGLSDIDFVAWCYFNILGRTPDNKGLQDWLKTLQNGGARDGVEQYFREQIITQNTFEEVRWRHSCRLRGEVEVADFAPMATSNIGAVTL